MQKEYADQEFLDFLLDNFFPDLDVSPFPDDEPTLRDIIEGMQNNDSAWEETYKSWCQAFWPEFELYKLDPNRYVSPDDRDDSFQ